MTKNKTNNKQKVKGNHLKSEQKESKKESLGKPLKAKKKKNKKLKTEMVESKSLFPRLAHTKLKDKDTLIKESKTKKQKNDKSELTPVRNEKQTQSDKSVFEKKTKHKLNDTEESDNSEGVILPKKFKLEKKTLKKEKNRKQFKKKRQESASNQGRPFPSTGTHTSPSVSHQTSSIKQDVARLKVSTGFNWDNQFTLPTSKTIEDSSSDESDDEQEKKVEKTRNEIRLEKKAEEKKIYEVEKRRLEGDDEPQTADDFDRLVLQSPDSSLVWTRYMAYHLECTEIDKARAVAERALKTISFRDEQEKLNIWVAYLNLENMYGTSDQLEELFERAKTNCDSKKIHQRMISVYVRSEKYEEAEQLYNVMVKRFHTDKQIWMNFVQFCFRNNRLDTGRKLLQRSFKCLEKKEHVEMISKVAQMEVKFGDGERGRTMYENLVANYPKRLDLWSVYIDMVRILGDFDGVRKLFERALSLKMNAKRMKFIFKKYLDFENQYGSPDKVEEIKEKALKYVESKGFYDEL
ncbi:protein RRP5 homolog [Patella vulgata]|uniref:protein RRP5 homolog n=1 Tax=Patella vulgata TaxID=6465 RepID=UPI00218009F5|nr:protein RRP5 homolog [Patella vulgata]